MADEILTDKDDDDDIEIVEVERLPEPGAPPAAEDEAEDAAGAGGDEEDDDEDDARMADSQDDIDDDITNGSKSREKRLKRREMQRAARERTERMLNGLQQQNAALIKRLEAVEGKASTHTVQQLESQLSSVQADIANAEAILAQAVEAGNGADVTEALRLRDAAKEREINLRAQKQSAEKTSPAGGAPDPRVAQLAQAWMQSNPWYKLDGSDQYSAATKQLDIQLQSEGYNPADLGFWQELTRRVNQTFGSKDAKGGKQKDGGKVADADDTSPRKKGPAVGAGRGDKTSVDTRRGVYVTPERKQAMMDAGVWDDPELRKKYLKSYQDFDRSNAAR